MASVSRRSFLILSATSLVIVAAAAFSLSQQRQAQAPQFETHLTFASFDSKIEQVQGLKIQTKDGVLTIERQANNQWAIVEKNHFPARIEAVRQVILGLADLEFVERKTAREDWHHHLGLVAPEDGGDGVLIEAWDNAGTSLARLVLGAETGLPDMDGRTRAYVRLPSEAQTYVARGRLSFGTEIDAWLDFDIVNVERVRIAKARSVGQSFVASRDSAEHYDFALSGVPKGFELSSEAAGNGLASALASLNFLDVRPGGEVDFSSASQVEFETFDGLGITVDVTRVKSDYWIRLTAKVLPGETSEGVDVGQGLSLSGTQEAEAINRRAQGWAFQVAEWKGDQLTVQLESLTKKIGEENE